VPREQQALLELTIPDQPMEIANGLARMPDVPGTGIEWGESAVSLYRVS